MPYYWGFAALLAYSVLQLPWVAANPTLDFPVNAQVPPVARALQPYIFVFSESTFTSTDGPLSYRISEQPTWLQLISGTRTFSGTPGLEDVGAASFELVAADNKGSTSTNVTLVTLAMSDLAVVQPVLPQLAKAGPTSGPASLLLHPLQEFTLGIDAGTFTNTNSNTEFYAVSANNTPLPNWVQFDSSSLAFSGTSPPLVSSTAAPQIYGIKLVASDVVGFSEASIDFQLVVGYHILTSTDQYQAINIVPGEQFSSTEFRNSLTLDGRIVGDSDITSVISDGPNWSHLNASSVCLRGIPPADAKSASVTIIVSDIYGDVLNIMVELIVASESSSLFAGTISDASAIAGDPFSYTIKASLLSSNEVHLSADLGSASAWLHFSPQNRTFYGTVPKKSPAVSETITLTATEGNSSQSKSFVIHISSQLHISSSSVKPTVSTKTSSLGSMTATSFATSQPGPEGSIRSNSNNIKIILATVLPSVLVILIVCLIICRVRRRARRNQQRNTIPPVAIVTPEVGHTSTADLLEVHPVPRTPERSPRRSNPSLPPQIALPWAPDSMRTSKNRMSKRSRAATPASLDSTWSDFVVAETDSGLERSSRSVRPVNAVRSLSQDDVSSQQEGTPSYTCKRSRISTPPLRQEPVMKRSSNRYSTMSMLSPGLPQRLSGAGHGAGGTPPPTFSEGRSSWQTTMGTIPALGSKRSTVVLNDFPSPPHDKNSQAVAKVLQARSPNRPPQATLRLVRNDSTRSSGLQKWYTDRARDRLEGSARFSSASSRPSSSSRVLWEDSVGGKVLSPPPVSDNESANGHNQQSLSGLARARRTASNHQFRGQYSYIRTPSKLRRDVSTTSSGQFDSAISTNSWEDDNLIEEATEESVKQWQRTATGSTPYRLPFEAVPASPQGAASLSVEPHRWRLTDNRNSINKADRQTKRPEKSKQGSLAFV